MSRYIHDKVNHRLKMVAGYDNSEELMKFAQSLSNRNLLDNPWFTVNQRGFTSGQLTSPYYFVDRWMFTGTAEVNSDGTITLSNTGNSDAYFVQRLPYADVAKLVDKPLVKSYDVVACSGTIYDYMGYYDSTNTYKLLETVKQISTTGIVEHNLTLSSFTPKSDKQFAEFTVNLNPGASITIKAIKLELGTVSTLALDTAPNYATELLKCQRYFYRQTFVKLQSIAHFDASSNWIQAYIHIPKMRTSSPTLNISGALGYVSTNGESVAANSYSCAETLDGYIIGGPRATTGTSTTGYIFMLDNDGGSISLSAEL